jgi:tetrahydromethanopterin S-methyltransferase subunit G
MTTARVDDLDAAVAAADDIGESYGELFGEFKTDLKQFVQQEVELAKAEVTAEVSKIGKAVGMFAGAALGALLVVIFLSTALWWGLANVMDQSWAALVVAGVWLVLTAVLALAGRGVLRSISLKPERTLNSLKLLPSAFTSR